jgi:radical SAM protein with 4Fe4S-binding SPASM domain
MATRSSRNILLPVDERRVIIFHSLLGSPQLVEFESEEDCRSFTAAAQAGPAHSGISSLDSILELTDDLARQQVAERAAVYLDWLPHRINFLSLLTSEACNLGCSYCIAGENMRSAASRKAVTMQWETAQTAIDWYFSILDPARKPYINFTGGEPLLNWPLVARTLEYVTERYSQYGKTLEFSINTNATLVTPNIAAVLKKHQVIVATSLDGAPSNSDLVRIANANRLGVSDRILAGWKNLAEAGHPITGFMATFNDKNIDGLNEAVVDFACEMKFSWLRVDCDVIHLQHLPPGELIERLWRVYMYGKSRGIAVEGFWSSAIHNMLTDTDAPVTFFCGAVSGETVSIHPDGRVSACGFSRATLGNVGNPTLLNAQLHTELVRSYVPGHREFCVGCEIEGSCAGGCNIAREEASANRSNSAIEYNCTIYREMTRRLLVEHFLEGPVMTTPALHAV